MSFKVLCVDDDPDTLFVLGRALRTEGYTVLEARDVPSAEGQIEQAEPHAVILDLRLPGQSGLELLGRLRETHPELPVLILTAHGGKQDAIEALRLGAYDFVEKPFRIEYLRHRMEDLRRRQQLAEENIRLKREVTGRYLPSNRQALSAPMRQVYEIVCRVCDSESTVLVHGESGTGKERVARAIHFGSHRSGKPFVPVDCAAISPSLFESELFGHARGAFTGAVEAREGLMRAAGQGTLFLDEIGEIPLELQPKLLRAIQERHIRPVGDTQSVPFLARLVVATNRDLAGEVKSGNFRQDLYYRINVVTIQLPPLRERREDIPQLVREFIEQFRSARHRVEGVAPAALQALQAYAWPGNVRELQHCLEQAIALGNGRRIELLELPGHIRSPEEASPVASPALDESDLSLLAAEKAAILRALHKAGGVKREAARLLKISATTLYRKIRSLGIPEDLPAVSK